MHKTNYYAEVDELFFELDKCYRQQSDDVGSVVDGILSLEPPSNYFMPPGMVFLTEGLKDPSMRCVDLLRYLFALNSDVKSSFDPYLYEVARQCYILGTPKLFTFITDDLNYRVPEELAVIDTITHNNFELLQFLVIEKKYSINSSFRNSPPPLFAATYFGHQHIVDFLLKNGVDIDAVVCGKPLLRYVIEANKISILCQVIKHVKSVGRNLEDIRDENGLGLLHWAIDASETSQDAQQKNLEFLVRVVGIREKDLNGLNILAYALYKNNLRMANFIASKYPELDADEQNAAGWNVLHFCSQEGRLDVIQTLIAKSSFRVDTPTFNKDNAMHIAAQNDHAKVLEFLIKSLGKGANKSVLVNSENKLGRHIGFYMLASTSKLQADLLVKLIKEYGLSVFSVDKSGQMFLELVIMHCSVNSQVLKVSIERAVQANKKQRQKVKKLFTKPQVLKKVIEFFDADGSQKYLSMSHCEDTFVYMLYVQQTPLHIICSQLEFADIQNYIVKNNCDLNIRNADGEMLLASMLNTGRFKNAKLFIQHYRPQLVNIDKHESSVLHLACQAGSNELVEWCLQNCRGLLLLSRSDGLLAVDIAINNANISMVRLLWSGMSSEEQQEYFVGSSADKRKYLVMHGIYNAVLDSQLTVVADLVVAQQTQEMLSEVLSDAAAEEVFTRVLEYSTHEEVAESLREVIDEQSEGVLETVGKEVVESLSEEYLDAAFTEEVSAKLVQDFVGSVLTKGIGNHLDRQQLEPVKKQYLSQSQKQQNCFDMQDGVSDTTTSQELCLDDMSDKGSARSDSDTTSNASVLSPVVQYTRESLIEAATRRDFNFFHELSTSSDHNHLLVNCAVELLCIAISHDDILFLQVLLRVQAIKNSAHLNNNYVLNLAKSKFLTEMVSILLKIPGVQRSIPAQEIPLLSPITIGFEPVSFKNPKNKIVINELAKILQKPKYLGFTIYHFGGGNYKYNPRDLDFLSPESNIDGDIGLVAELIKDLLQSGARVTVTDAKGRPGYCSPKHNPVRRVVPIEWFNCRLEVIITRNSIFAHASELDYRVGAVYCDAKTLTVYEFPEISGIFDYNSMILDTVQDPYTSFAIDLSRILRGINIVATCNLQFSMRCNEAILSMFSDNGSNPFFTYNMHKSKVHQQLAILFSAANPYKNIQLIFCMNVLGHLLDFLSKQSDPHSRIYAERLNSMHAQNVQATQQAASYANTGFMLFSPESVSNSSKDGYYAVDNKDGVKDYVYRA